MPYFTVPGGGTGELPRRPDSEHPPRLVGCPPRSACKSSGRSHGRGWRRSGPTSTAAFAPNAVTIGVQLVNVDADHLDRSFDKRRTVPTAAYTVHVHWIIRDARCVVRVALLRTRLRRRLVRRRLIRCRFLRWRCRSRANGADKSENREDRY